MSHKRRTWQETEEELWEDRWRGLVEKNPYEMKMSKKDNEGKRYLTLTRIGSNMSSASCLLEHFLYAYKNAPESSIKPSYHYITQAIIHKMQHSFLS
jgi:hypothetical protein